MLTDLHRHLDGSLRPATYVELREAADLDVPDVRFTVGMGLHDALRCFAHTLAILRSPDAVERVAAEVCEDALVDGVEVLEIRFAPVLHAARWGDVVDAALSGIDGRAGLILCGLWNESPRQLAHYVELAAGRPGVVGIDLAGGPSPGDRFALQDYAGPFTRARDIGLGRTVHAGEGRPPDEIRTAIEVLHAQRIGHGTTLLDDPEVLDLVLERGVTIEACVTSNWHVGAIPAIDAHPLPRWLDLGVRACINTDNTLMSDVTASEEYARVGRIPGMTPEKLALAVRNGREAAFQR